MHIFANPTRFLAIARPLTPWLFWAGTVLIVIGCVLGLGYAPPEEYQGDTVRILYIHVPAAWLGMGGWSGIAIAAIAQLVWRHPLAAIAGRAVAVPGALFTGICLATGSLWGRPAWGTWWEWDGRMTSMLVLLFLYLGYIALANASTRDSAGLEGGASKVTAVFALVGAVNLPIINRSVVWWNSLHQPASITLKGSAIASPFLLPLLFTIIGFSLWFAAVVLMRMRMILATARVEARLQRLARG